LTLRVSMLCLFQCRVYHRDLPPFPTRRSSDLSCVSTRSSSPGACSSAPRIGMRMRLPSYAPAAHAGERVVSRNCSRIRIPMRGRSEEHTSELQSHLNLVCRLLLENKKLHINTK